MSASWSLSDHASEAHWVHLPSALLAPGFWLLVPPFCLCPFAFCLHDVLPIYGADAQTKIFCAIFLRRESKMRKIFLGSAARQDVWKRNRRVTRTRPPRP